MTEAQLVSRLKDGDREAFDIMVKAYQSKIINLSYGLLSSQEDAYDAAQETFIRIYKNISAFKGTSSLSTWIYRICTNVCNDILRKRMRSGGIVSIDTDDDADNPMLKLTDTAPTPEQSAERNERVTIVRKAIDLLAEDYKTVLVMYDIEDMSYEEISKILNCPIGTIKSRLNRARSNLKKILSQNRELF